MPPRGVTSEKRKRQYEKIKKSVKARGRSEATASRIAAATTNRTRAAKGETKTTMSTTARKRAQSGLRAAGRKGGQARKKKTTTSRT